MDLSKEITELLWSVSVQGQGRQQCDIFKKALATKRLSGWVVFSLVIRRVLKALYSLLFLVMDLVESFVTSKDANWKQLMSLQNHLRLTKNT